MPISMLQTPLLASRGTSPVQLTALRSGLPTVPVIENVRVPVTAVKSPLVASRVQAMQPMTTAVPRFPSTIPSVPVIETPRVPVTAIPTPRMPVATAAPTPAVLPKTDLFEVPTKRPTLAKRLPPAMKLPTKAAEQAVMPGGMKRVVGHDLAPIRAIRPRRPSVPGLPEVPSSAPDVVAPTFAPPARMTSTLYEKVAQNPFDSAMTAGGPVPSPPWYVDNYMHEYDKVPVSGLGEDSSPDQTWGWFLAAGLAVSAAWLYAKSR